MKYSNNGNGDHRKPSHKHDLNILREWFQKQIEPGIIELTNILRWEDDGGLILETTTLKGPALEHVNDR